MSRNVYMSYAARDGSHVPRVLNRLREQAVLSIDDNVFVDRDSFMAGDSFRDATREAIGAADTVVVLWSPAAAGSKWVNYELAMADALGKQLIVVTSKADQDRLPIDAQAVQWVEIGDMASAPQFT